jgi:hypothetical protein
VWLIAFIVLQGLAIWSGIRQEERAGLWSWSKIFFSLGFGALECLLMIAPLFLIPNPYRLPACIAAWVLAALYFVWLIIVMRRWNLRDGRKSLEAVREQRW